MVHESLLRALKDNGLEEILAEGKESDPNSTSSCRSR